MDTKNTKSFLTVKFKWFKILPAEGRSVGIRANICEHPWETDCRRQRIRGKSSQPPDLLLPYNYPQFPDTNTIL